MQRYLAIYNVQLSVISKEDREDQIVHPTYEFNALNESEAREIAQNYIPKATSKACSDGEKFFESVFSHSGPAVLERLLIIKEVPFEQSPPKLTQIIDETGWDPVANEQVNAQKVVRRIDAMEPGYSEAGD